MSNTTYGAIKLATAEDIGAVLKKKMGTVNGYKPKEWAETINLLGKLPTRTATGAIAHFIDGADDVPIVEGVFEFNPVQTGTGDPSPSNTRPITGFTGLAVSQTGANVWDEEWLHGYYDRNNQGNFVPNASYICSKNMIAVKPSTTFYWAIDFSASFSGRVLYYDINGDYLSASEATAPKAIFTTPSDCYFIHFYFYIPSGYGSDYGKNVSINYPSTDTSYHAYTGRTYIISWTSEGAKYGGSYDSKTGVLSVNRGEIDMGDLNYTKFDVAEGTLFRTQISGAYVSCNLNNILCSKYKYSTKEQRSNYTFSVPDSSNVDFINNDYSDATAFKTAMEGAKIVYTLATPLEIQLEPTSNISTLLGVNNFFHDGNGDSTINYRADIDILINELGG